MFKMMRKVQRKWFYSFVGFWTVLKEEKSIWVYLTLLPVLIGLGVWVDLSPVKWALTITIVGLVLCTEIMNTALEATVDTISFQYNVKVKKIKDIASAATLIITLGAFAALLFIYIPAIQEVI